MKRRKEEKVEMFNNDGTIRETELKIVNFRPIGTNNNNEPESLNKQWEEVRIYVYCVYCIFINMNHEPDGNF